VKRVARWTIHIVGLLMALAFGGALYQRVSSLRELARLEPPGQLVDIGGRRLHLMCKGAGAPTVILEESGLGTYRSWDAVQSALAPTMRVCSYDRAGNGFSEPGPPPRDARHLADDLSALLRVAKLEPPYILVGHSAGGLVVRLWAAEHPDQVKGLVLVDTAPEELFHEQPRVFARMKRNAFWGGVMVRLGLLRLVNPFHLDGEDRALTYRAEAFDAVFSLVSAFPESAAQLAAAPPLPDVPTRVLTHSHPGDWAGEGAISAAQADAVEAAWQAAQVRLAAKSSKGRVTVVPNAGHMIPQEAPAAVVAAIRDVAAAH
jgi:pimeloyl-ACP methyl ester carboxylesterase